MELMILDFEGHSSSHKIVLNSCILNFFSITGLITYFKYGIWGSRLEESEKTPCMSSATAPNHHQTK